MENVYIRDIIHFSYNITANEENSLSEPFVNSRLKEFNSSMDRGAFCIVPRSEVKLHGIYCAFLCC